MPDILSINGEPIEVSGDITQQDVENGRTLAEALTALLLFLYLFGHFDRTGKRIPEAMIRREVDRLVMHSAGRIELATRQLLAGDISLSIWQARVRNILRAGYSVTGSIAKGGIRNMSPRDWEILSRLSARQAGFLNRFAGQLADGIDASEAQIINRAKSYATSIRSIGQQMILETAKQGRQFARRVLTPAEHCEGCITEAGKGWQPAEFVAPIGSQECMSHCRCYIEFQDEAPDARSQRQREMSDRFNNPPTFTVRL